eukprot:9501798-Pyramimonas_sp.AAC.1
MTTTIDARRSTTTTTSTTTVRPGLPASFPLGADMRHKGTLARFLTEQILARKLLNAHGGFFADAWKDNTIKFEPPHA